MSESGEVWVRPATRVIVIDGEGRTLLFRGIDPARPETPPWWFPPGGGRDEGETIEACGRRELAEEIGLVVDDLGPVVHERRTTFSFDGRLIEAHESYFVVRVGRTEIVTDGWTEMERRVIAAHRWWTIDELRTTTETVFPEALIELLETHTAG